VVHGWVVRRTPTGTASVRLSTLLRLWESTLNERALRGYPLDRPHCQEGPKQVDDTPVLRDAAVHDAVDVDPGYLDSLAGRPYPSPGTEMRAAARDPRQDPLPLSEIRHLCLAG
jgi:hypothetical protein